MSTSAEELESLKSWWKENARSVITGVVLGFAIIGGWFGWQEYSRNKAENASSELATLIRESLSEDSASVIQRSEKITEQFGDGNYSSLASLIAASKAWRDNDLKVAHEHLSYTVQHAKDKGIQQIAKLRLAILELDKGNPDQTLSLLNEIDNTAFKAIKSEISGDAYLVKEQKSEAITAYQEALREYDDSLSAQQRVRLKLDSLGSS